MKRVSLGVAVLLASLLASCTDGPRGMQAIDGSLQFPESTENARAVVWFFVTNDCPIANGYAPEIQKIADDYAPAGIRFFLVHVDPDVTRAQASEHAKAYGYHGLPILIDREHVLVAKAGATITPEAAVWSEAGEMVYRGRIDNLYTNIGPRNKRPAATQHDLRDAIDAVMTGRMVAVPRTEAVGCDIPDLD